MVVEAKFIMYTLKMLLRVIAQVVSVVVVTTALVFVYAWDYFVLSGVLELTFNAGEDSAYIELFGGSGQFVENDQGDFVVESGTRIPFTLKPPRPFTTLTMRLWSDNIDSQREIATHVDVGDGRVYTQNMYLGDARLKALDELGALPDVSGGPEQAWNSVTDGNITLWQRASAPQYGSLEDFWNAPQDFSTIAALNVNVETYVENVFATKALPAKAYQYDGTVRGEYSLVVIPHNGNVEFTFNRIDVNRYAGEDSIRVELMRGIQLVDAQTLFTDELEPAGTHTSQETIQFSGLENAVYHVNIKTTTDTFLRNIESPYHPIVFESSVMLADGAGYDTWFLGRNNTPTTYVWHGSEMKISNPHAQGGQTALVDDQLVSVGITPITLNFVPGLHEISLSDRGTKLQFDGVLLASAGELVIPPQRQVKSLQNQNDLSALQYIVESRTGIQTLNGEEYIQAELLPSQFAINDDGQIRGSIAIPYADEESERLTFSRMEWILEKEPIRIKEIPRRILEKLGL